MRKLFNEFFYIPKHGKIREKVMLTRVVMTITIMVLCLAAMSITAYAYFSYNVTSGSNIIKAASFYTDVTVQITAEDGTAVDTIKTNTSDHKAHGASLEANKTYTITVKHNERSTAQTGFVIITADKCGTKYHTQQLGRDGDGNTDTITFKLTPGANTIVTFQSHWGTSSFYADFMEIGENDEQYILDGEKIELTIDGVAPSNNKGGTEDPSVVGSEGTTTENTNTSTGTESSSTQTPENTTTPSTETTPPVETTPPETSGSSEPTSTTEPGTSTSEPTATQPTETTPAETSGTEATETTDTTDTTASTETQPTEETTGAPTTEANE